MALAYIGNEATTARQIGHVDKVVKTVMPSIDFDRPDRTLINVQNGVVSRQTLQFSPHEPDFASVIQIPVEFDADATCPQFEQFLREFLPEDCQRAIRQFLGYCLVPDIRHKLAFLFLGEPNSGKTQLLNLISEMLGKENCSSASLTTLTTRTFGTVDLFGKLANICGDIDSTTLKETGTFKQIVGGDPLRAEQKNQPAFKFNPYARLIFSANKIPGTTDHTNAYYQRWYIFPTLRQTKPREDWDPNLVAKWMTEASGILNLALAGLRDLDAAKQFDLPSSVAAAHRQYRLESDSGAGFVDEECELDPATRVTGKVLYLAYQAWISNTGRVALNRPNFYERLLAIPGVGRVDPKGLATFTGLKVRGVAS